MKLYVPRTMIIAGLMAVAILFLACQQKQESGPAESINQPKQIIYKLKLGHDMPVDSAQHVAAMQFADIVRQKSNGRVHVKVFPAQELGNDHQMIEAARAGKLAIILPPTAKLSTLAPSLQYADLPFLFPTRQDAYELLDGEPGKLLLEKLKPHGLIGVAFWESGFKQFTANRDIRSPEDFKNLKIRVMKSRIIMDQFKGFGAIPIPIDFHAAYQALKDGVVDGQENPLVSIVNMKFHEVQSHVIISNHAYLAYIFAFSKTIFESLPTDIQKILSSTARELTAFERKETIEREKAFIQTIKDSGTTVRELTDEERMLFYRAAKHVTEKNRDVIGPAIIEKTEQLLAQKYVPRENEIVLGLDADMTLGSAPSGLAIKRGMQLAVREINAQGGLLGKKIKIITRDHGGISARGIANMKYFGKLKNLVAVMGGLHSPVALSELDIIHKEKIIYLDPWAAATPIVENGFQPNYVFRVSVRDEFAGPFLVKQALRKYKKIALLLENTGWGRSNHRAMTNALAENRLTPAAVEWFNWGEENMHSQLARIEAQNAQVILLVANAPEGINVMKTMARRSKKLPVISHWGITGGYFWEQAGRELAQIDLSFLQTFSFISADNPKARKVIRNYAGMYGLNHPGEIVMVNKNRTQS